MRSRDFYTTLIFVAVLPVLLVILAVGRAPPDSVTQKSPSLDTRQALIGQSVDDAASDRLTPTATQPAAPEATLAPDGAALLKQRCSQCHIADLLEKMEKPRAEWEAALAQMEAIGVKLADDEKIVILNHLAGIDQP